MTESNKAENQLNQLHDSLNKVDDALIDLSVTTSFACVPKTDDCETVLNNPGQLGASPLITILQDLDNRVLAIVRKVVDINERIEL